ncbi:MAG: DUF2996 domain-containing protein [Oscillatoriales cyanobacterium SM2_1_8]|nr:DUF2996 domain-containing protein [Oscillatoriales cyanobacterium SM2_1_8]
MAETPETATETAPETGAQGAPPKATRPAKEKAPALEDLPFAEFVGQYFGPKLGEALQAAGATDAVVEVQELQVRGRWGSHQFAVYFAKPELGAQKAFACGPRCRALDTVEPFLIDERKITLDLLVFGVMQRLNAQKWLTAN